jgi:hypothetical protein
LLVGILTAVAIAPLGIAVKDGFTQEIVGVTSSFLDTASGQLGDVAFAANGDVWSSECLFSGTRLHRFAVSGPPIAVHGTDIFPESIVPATGAGAGGCGLLNYPDGTIYSNMDNGLPDSPGLANLDAATGDLIRFLGPAGNGLGITVDPLTKHIIYVAKDCRLTSSCTIYDLDPTTGSAVTFAYLDGYTDFVDGIYFEPNGNYLFAVSRHHNDPSVPQNRLLVVDRGSGFVYQIYDLADAVHGLSFHATSPKFMVASNENGGMTRFDFPGDDYLSTPTVSVFASGGFRGNLSRVGHDGCIYVTQNGTRYNDGTVTAENSVVKICGGFAPAPGTENIGSGCQGKIGDKVWLDLDGNGIQDAGEAGIAGATVTLEDQTGKVLSTTTTNANGTYVFTGLCPGTYFVAVTAPAGMTVSPSQAGSDRATDSNASPSLVTLTEASRSDLTIDFGFVSPAVGGSISGTAYLDLNRNRARDAGEPGVAGVGIGLAGASTGTRSTAGDGGYLFDKLAGGTYSVSAAATAAGLKLSTASPVSIALTAGQSQSSVDFGYSETQRPACTAVVHLGSPLSATMIFTDASGIAKVTIVRHQNFQTVIQPFTPGATSVTVTATGIDKRKDGIVTVQAADMFGNTTTCDPVAFKVAHVRSEHGMYQFVNLSQVEGLLTITNGRPGLRRIEVIVNGVRFRRLDLDDNEEAVLDIHRALRRGHRNHVMLLVSGKRGSSADVTISTRPTNE